MCGGVGPLKVKNYTLSSPLLACHGNLRKDTRHRLGSLSGTPIERGMLQKPHACDNLICIPGNALAKAAAANNDPKLGLYGPYPVEVMSVSLASLSAHCTENAGKVVHRGGSTKNPSLPLRATKAVTSASGTRNSA